MDAPIMDTPFLDALEALLDRSSMASVLDSLEHISYAKAEHLRSNWQDGATAKQWDGMGATLANCAKVARERGLK